METMGFDLQGFERSNILFLKRHARHHPHNQSRFFSSLFFIFFLFLPPRCVVSLKPESPEENRAGKCTVKFRAGHERFHVSCKGVRDTLTAEILQAGSRAGIPKILPLVSPAFKFQELM